MDQAAPNPPVAPGLCLRPFTSADVSAVQEFSDDPLTWIERRRIHLMEFGHTYWAVCDATAGDILGFCGLLTRPQRGTTLGYATITAARGNHVATRAARAVIEWASAREINFHASIRPPNPVSVRVLHNVGMAKVAVEYDDDGERWIFRSTGPRSGVAQPGF